MNGFDEHFESARRHFGVALIDLNYAAADLARSCMGRDVDDETRAAMDLLNREITRLREVSTLIERAAPEGTFLAQAASVWSPEPLRRSAEG